MVVMHLMQMNVRENRRGNNEWTIQRNWQHRVHKAQGKPNKTKNTTQYVLDTAIATQAQIA
jgi:hypothetical protein